jgi:hypothetical protein
MKDLNCAVLGCDWDLGSCERCGRIRWKEYFTCPLCDGELMAVVIPIGGLVWECTDCDELWPSEVRTR